jgi:hypothetical protein
MVQTLLFGLVFNLCLLGLTLFTQLLEYVWVEASKRDFRYIYQSSKDANTPGLPSFSLLWKGLFLLAVRRFPLHCQQEYLLPHSRLLPRLLSKSQKYLPNQGHPGKGPAADWASPVRLLTPPIYGGIEQWLRWNFIWHLTQSSLLLPEVANSI